MILQIEVHSSSLTDFRGRNNAVLFLNLHDQIQFITQVCRVYRCVTRIILSSKVSLYLLIIKAIFRCDTSRFL